MKRTCLLAVLTVAPVFISTGCRNDVERRIAGKYEHPDILGQSFEFHADHTFVNTVGAGTMDCVIKRPGTWKVEGDSLFISNDIQNTTYEFGDSVTEEDRALVKELFDRMDKKRTEKAAFKVIQADENVLSLETDGKITTYVRTDKLKQ